MKLYDIKVFFEHAIKTMLVHEDGIHCDENCPYKVKDPESEELRYYCKLTYQFIENNERNHICLKINKKN